MQDSLEIILEDPNTSGQVSSIKSLSKSVDKVLADVKLFSQDPLQEVWKVTAKGQPSEVDKSDGNNELVNKLLVDLNTAKKEISEAKAVNRQERQALNERIAFLKINYKLRRTIYQLQIISCRDYEKRWPSVSWNSLLP